MRIRRKPWTEPELLQSPYFVDAPDDCRGAWREKYAGDAPLHIELGCGKCVSTSLMALEHPEIHYLAIDEVRTVLAVGCRLLRAAFPQGGLANLLLTCADACELQRVLAPEDGVERVYIAFPNPWTQRAAHHKRRLTHPRQLMLYRSLLPMGGEIWLKTDDDALWRASLRYFAECGFGLRYSTDDLAASGFAPNYISEHERLYREQGKPIHFCIAEKRELPEGAGQDTQWMDKITKKENVTCHQKRFRKPSL